MTQPMRPAPSLHLLLGAQDSAAASPAQDEDLDSAWLMVFLNLVLVILAFFVMIFSIKQLAAKRQDQAPAVDPQQQERRQERLQALAMKEKLQRLLKDRQMNGSVVDLHQGRARIILSGGVLFESASAQLTPVASARLAEIAQLLRTTRQRIMVEGHTDDRPIRTARFPSNWELSTARALAVVKLFGQQGIPPDRLKFVGYGEHRPKVTNDTEANRQQNRRIEIKVQ